MLALLLIRPPSRAYAVLTCTKSADPLHHKRANVQSPNAKGRPPTPSHLQVHGSPPRTTHCPRGEIKQTDQTYVKSTIPILINSPSPSQCSKNLLKPTRYHHVQTQDSKSMIYTLFTPYNQLKYQHVRKSKGPRSRSQIHKPQTKPQSTTQAQIGKAHPH